MKELFVYSKERRQGRHKNSLKICKGLFIKKLMANYSPCPPGVGKWFDSQCGNIG